MSAFLPALKSACGKAALWTRALQRHRLQASLIAFALADAT
jgi:hypothetical protein